MSSGILLTTNHNVYGVYRDGDRVKLTGDGSLFVSWDEISRVDVEGQISKHFHKSFFPPDLNTAMINNATEVLSKDLHYDDMKHVWFDIYRGNRSIENDIIRRTSNEIELLKTGLIPKEIHMSMWGSFGVLIIVLMVLTFVCWRKNRKSKTVYISTVV